MVLDSLSSPNTRSNSSFSFAVKKPSRELGSCSAVLERHRFLLTMLALLIFLCAIYLYFAVTMGNSDSEQCLGLLGADKELCMGKISKISGIHKGKMRLY